MITNSINNFKIDNDYFGKNNEKSKKECIIDRMVKEEIEAGVPEHRRTKVWFVSCPCPKCSPCYL